MNVRELIARFRGQRQFHVDFMGRRRRWFLLSGAFLLISVFGLLVLKLNLGIDFQGGALLQYPNAAGLTTQEVQSTMARLGRGDAVVQLVDAQQEVTVRTETLGDERAPLLGALSEQAGVQPSDINVQDVGPKWGEQISRKALQGLIIFLIVVTIYISFRFEWKMAVGAIAALIHDLIITAGFYALVGREVTPETVIAILTIMGYSLYDTVVIYDKIQENVESPALVARETYSGTVNLSLNQVLMRSVNTSLTSLLPIGALLLLGGDTLKNFAFALFVGIGVGTYSSLFVAAPVLSVLKEREPRLTEIRNRAQRRARALRPVPAPAAAEPDLEPVPTRAPEARPRPTPAPRRPRKQPRSKRKKKKR